MTQALVMTISKTAERAGVPECFIRQLVKDGKIHSVRSGRRIYVAWYSVVEYLCGKESNDL